MFRVYAVACWKAQAEVLLANIHSSMQRPAVVLTDLKDSWHIYWMDGLQPCWYSELPRADALTLLQDVLYQAHFYDLKEQGNATIPAELKQVVEVAEAGRFSRLFKRRRLRSTLSSIQEDGPLANLLSLRGMMGSLEREQQLVCDINRQVLLEIDEVAGLSDQGIWSRDTILGLGH